MFTIDKNYCSRWARIPSGTSAIWNQPLSDIGVRLAVAGLVRIGDVVVLSEEMHLILKCELSTWVISTTHYGDTTKTIMTHSICTLLALCRASYIVVKLTNSMIILVSRAGFEPATCPLGGAKC